MNNRKLLLSAQVLVVTLSVTAVAVGLSAVRSGGTILGLDAVRPSVTSASGSTAGIALSSARETDMVKDAKPKKDKTAPPPEGLPSAEVTPTPPAEPPAPEEPPADPAAAEEPPVAPDAPGAVASVACISGDMQDLITFAAPAAGGVVDGFSLFRADTVDGAYSLVATAPVDAQAFAVSVDTTATPYYQVAATGPGGQGMLSESVTNSHVSIAAEVTPSGATLRSSNGEVSLVFPAGSVGSTSTVSIEEVEGTPTGGIISLSGVYDLSSSEPLIAPVRLSVAYTINVTHFQVSAAMLSQAKLMTYDVASKAWSDGATDIVAADGVLSGDLSHFSYWSVDVIQPHGTQSTAYCADGGICHNLSAYPDATTRVSSRDPQVCYNCHGSADLAGAPAGASGENVQAAIAGVASLSHHPVAIGDLYCTACHDPHANPTSSPGMLRAIDPLTGKYVQGGSGLTPGKEFCWTCHGTISNRRTSLLVPWYFTNTNGDKKTGFNGAHTNLRTTTERYEYPQEFARGFYNGTQWFEDWTVGITRSAIELPKAGVNPIASPAISGNWGGTGAKAAYDGDWVNTKLYWDAATMGATSGNGWIGTSSLTIDLGSPTQVESFDALFINNLSCIPDVIEVQASDTGLDGSWTTIASQGGLGTRLPGWDVSLTGSATCRYVRFVFVRDFTTEPTTLIGLAEVAVDGLPSAGTYTIRPDIARKATYSSGSIRWQANVLPHHTFVVEARASLDNGTTWTGWQEVTNGGALTQIPAGANLERALMEVRVSMGTSITGDSPLLGMIEVTTTRGDITGSTPQWTGTSPANECQRCHVSHGSTKPGLMVTNSTGVCTTCHSAAYGSSYMGSAQFNASAHSAVQCSGCHSSHGTYVRDMSQVSDTGVYSYLLKGPRQEMCFGCHTATKEAFDAVQASPTQWARHDIYSSDQTKTGSRLECRNCHSAHSSTGLVDPDSITTPYTTLRDDPTTIPTAEVVIYASKDTVIDSTAGQENWNFGASEQATIQASSRILLYFDLSAIPAGVTIQNATLILWGSDADYHTYNGGAYTTYPITQAWAEGTGTGTPNDASINGATWQERQFGTAWTTAGGDFGAASGMAATGVAPQNVTDMVSSQYQGTNLGIMVGQIGTVSMPIYLRETAIAQHRPHLRIVYRTGPASSEKIVDDVTFCTKCHDSSMPLGLSGQTMGKIGQLYPSTTHGAKKGLGPESGHNNFYSFDEGGGGLKAPYYYGMDSIPCTTCHDPHGSRLPYHLRNVVNGRDMTPVLCAGWDDSTISQGPALGYFCGACHIFPTNHAAYETSEYGCRCHSHGN